MMTRALTWSSLAGLGLAMVALTAAMSRPATPDSMAHFNEKGELLRPVDYRSWVFVGTPLTPNELNDGQAAFPEFHNVYLDPASYEHYKTTGEFRDGAVIVKELVSVGTKTAPSGKGFFEGNFLGVEAMVKNKERFAKDPGNWGFFRFTDEEASAKGKLGTVKRLASNVSSSCTACHAAGDQDRVFIQYYPVLRAARSAKRNPEND